MRDAVRLAFGTLSVLPLGHPSAIERRTWGHAMTLAPLVGLVLGALAWVVAWGVTEASTAAQLGAVAGIATLAVLTRGLHLDGLADVADGLGSRRPPEGAREVMKRSDIGPFGVATLVLVLLAQVASLERSLTGPASSGALALVGAAVVSRAAITMTCRRGVHAAVSDGLGAQVCETLTPTTAALVTGTSSAAVVAAAAIVDAEQLLAVAISVAAGLLAAEVWRRHCSRRFDGVTGDVLGAVEQVAFTGFLVALALVQP